MMRISWRLTLPLLAMLGSLAIAQPAPVPDSVKVTITEPKEDGFSLWINEEMPVAATAVPDNGVTIRWTATTGSFFEPLSDKTAYIVSGLGDNLTLGIILTPSAFRDGVYLSSARVAPDKPRTGAKATDRGLPPMLFVAAVNSAPAATVDQAKVELEYYNSNWLSKIGNPPGKGTAEFIHEVYGVDHAEDRDSRVQHIRQALALRPDDASNIVLEFRLATMLTQNPDLVHNQPTRPEEGYAVAEHLVEHYDHKAYYRDETIGESEAPEYLVPRAAIWVSSYNSAITKDWDKARRFADIAVGDLDWTFRERTNAWANAPMPSTQPSPFDRRPGAVEARIKAWEQRKAGAAAGEALGAYSESLCDAAVSVYVKAYSAGPADDGRVLQEVMAKYPHSPLATAAEKRMAKLPKSAVAGGPPVDPAPVTIPSTEDATAVLAVPVLAAPVPDQSLQLPLVLAMVGAAMVLGGGAVWWSIRSRKKVA